MTATQVLRPLTRYTGYDQVQAIILATGRAMNAPREINGKPIRVVDLGRAWL